MLLMEEELIIEKTKRSEGLWNMVTNKGFFLKLCSDLDFEGMIVDICFDDQRIASVNYDKGIDNIEVAMLTQESSRHVFNLSDFVNILEKAKNLAIKCAKEDGESLLYSSS